MANPLFSKTEDLTPCFLRNSNEIGRGIQWENVLEIMVCSKKGVQNPNPKTAKKEYYYQARWFWKG